MGLARTEEKFHVQFFSGWLEIFQKQCHHGFFEDAPSLVVGQYAGFVSRLWVSRYLQYFRPLIDRDCLRTG